MQWPQKDTRWPGNQKDRQCNGHRKIPDGNQKDRQHNGHRKIQDGSQKDRQHNGHRKIPDGQVIRRTDNTKATETTHNDLQNTTQTLKVKHHNYHKTTGRRPLTKSMF